MPGVQSVGGDIDRWESTCEHRVAALAGGLNSQYSTSVWMPCVASSFFPAHAVSQISKVLLQQAEAFQSRLGHVDRGMNIQYDPHAIPDAMEDSER